MSNGLGTASLENKFEGPKYFKLRTPDPTKGEEKTELIVRLLPSMHSYRETGDWRFFYAQHFGYFGNNPRDPSRPKSRPFGCIQKKNKDKTILVRCPKCEQVNKYFEKKDQRIAELLAANPGVDSKSAEFSAIKKGDEKLKRISEWLQKHNTDKKFWMNVQALNGEFGVLRLSYDTTEKVLMPFLRELKEKRNIFALDPVKGVWLRFTRTGSNPSVKDSVELYKELVDVNGEQMERFKYAPLDDAAVEKLLKVCPDLKLGVVNFIPVETIQKLVECNGDPDEVDRIWPPIAKKTEAAPAAAAPALDEDFSEHEELPAQEQTLPPVAGIDTACATPTDTKVTVATLPPPAPEVDEEAEAMAALEAARARKAAKLAAAAPAAVSNAKSFLEQFAVK